MVDHKLGGLARRIRRCNTIIQKNENWLEDVLSEIGVLYLITKGLCQLDRHSHSMQTKLLTLAGKSITKKEVLATTPTSQTS